MRHYVIAAPRIDQIIDGLKQSVHLALSWEGEKGQILLSGEFTRLISVDDHNRLMTEKENDIREACWREFSGGNKR